MLVFLPLLTISAYEFPAFRDPTGYRHSLIKALWGMTKIDPLASVQALIDLLHKVPGMPNIELPKMKHTVFPSNVTSIVETVLGSLDGKLDITSYANDLIDYQFNLTGNVTIEPKLNTSVVNQTKIQEDFVEEIVGTTIEPMESMLGMGLSFGMLLFILLFFTILAIFYYLCHCFFCFCCCCCCKHSKPGPCSKINFYVGFTLMVLSGVCVIMTLSSIPSILNEVTHVVDIAVAGGSSVSQSADRFINSITQEYNSRTQIVDNINATVFSMIDWIIQTLETKVNLTYDSIFENSSTSIFKLFEAGEPMNVSIESLLAAMQEDADDFETQCNAYKVFNPSLQCGSHDVPKFNFDLSDMKKQLGDPIDMVRDLIQNQSSSITDMANGYLEKMTNFTRDNKIDNMTQIKSFQNSMSKYKNQSSINESMPSLVQQSEKINSMIDQYGLYAQLGIIFLGLVIIVTALIFTCAFHGHGCCAGFIASTAECCPLVGTIIFFGLGAASLLLSIIFYLYTTSVFPVVDTAIDTSLGIVKNREIVISSINLTKLIEKQKMENYTKGLSLQTNPLVFKIPQKYSIFNDLLTSASTTGLDTVFKFDQILNFSQFGDLVQNIFTQVDKYLENMPDIEIINSSITMAKEMLFGKNQTLGGNLSYYYDYETALNEIEQNITSSCTVNFGSGDTDVCPNTRIAFAYLRSNISNITVPTFSRLHNVVDREIVQMLDNIENVIYKPVYGYISEIIGNVSSLFGVLSTIPNHINQIQIGPISGLYSAFSNTLFADLGSITFYLSLGAHFFIIGSFLVVNTLCWRRRGMGNGKDDSDDDYTSTYESKQYSSETSSSSHKHRSKKSGKKEKSETKTEAKSRRNKSDSSDSEVSSDSEAQYVKTSNRVMASQAPQQQTQYWGI